MLNSNATDRETSLVVTLRSAGGRGTLTLEIPGGVALRRLLPHLLTVAELSAVRGGGRLVEYEVVHRARCCVLSNSESLLSNGVVTGDELLLVARPLLPAGEEEGEGSSRSGSTFAQREGGPDTRSRAESGKLSISRAGWRQIPPDGSHRSWDDPRLLTEEGLVDRDERRGGKVIAVWSGPAGGTGRTVVALGLAIAATERGWRTALLGLAGPALSIYLGLPRRPDESGEMEAGLLPSAGARVLWRSGGSQFGMDVTTGAAGWRSGVRSRGQVSALLSDARTAHDTVIVDLPPLVPGPAASALESLAQAAKVVLVVPPSALGVAATVDGLACVRDLPFRMNATPRAVLVLNRRAPVGLSTTEFAEAVARVWGSCPHIAAEVGFSPDLARALDRGQILGSPILSKPMASLVEALLGSPDQAP